MLTLSVLLAICCAGAAYAGARSSAQGYAARFAQAAAVPAVEAQAQSELLAASQAQALLPQPGPQMLDPTRVFPLPRDAAYSYEDGFGDARAFGGERLHEGVDIIADEGTPVRSVCNGVITKKGWLTLGGWRIGVTDAFGVYHYYAHLSAYAEGLEVGDAVSAGQVLGYVGSTGYGEEGTADQMIPHLHFGLYLDDIAVDPYPYLLAWDPYKEG